jgi:hypothetical protein
MTERWKKEIFLGIIILACIVCGIWIFSGYFNAQSIENQYGTDIIPATTINQTFHAQNISMKFQSITSDYFSIDTRVPETPRSLPLYKGILSADDQERYFKYQSPNWTKRKSNTPTKNEAPDLAKKALEAYGGLPQDAFLSGVFISESITQTSSGEITGRYPVMTQVFFKRQINGMPVTGERDVISVDLGENGELLAVMKHWRTLEKTGEVVQVISPDKAVEKLTRGETYTKLQSPSSVLIDSVRLGYYEKPGNIREIILEPVWVFKNTDDPVYEFPVYARQFANFSQTPAITTKTVAGKSVQENDPFTVTFTDNSDASPTKWLWDFGDGTTSTERNPTHKYKTAGTYNVTLTVWNDLGSDTMTQQYVVEGAPEKKAEVQESITASDTIRTGNETIVNGTATSTATVLLTVNETAILTTTITTSATTITTIPTTVTAASSTMLVNATQTMESGNTTVL